MKLVPTFLFLALAVSTNAIPSAVNTLQVLASQNASQTNECNPTKGCNVCSACCKDYIADGSVCDACVAQSCEINVCDPLSCNVCDACCKSYLADSTACNECVASECETVVTCAHDGTWDSNTKKCTNCAGAWKGDDCLTYDTSVAISTQKNMEDACATGSQQMLAAQALMSPSPLCDPVSHVQCAGWGVVNYGYTQGAMPASFPFVTLSYIDKNKICCPDKIEPLEAIVTPQTVTGALSSETVVLRSIDSFKKHIETTYTAASPPGGTVGVFSETYKSVYNDYFKSGRGIAVTTAYGPIANLKLPTSSITNTYNYKLDKFSKRNVAILPPPPTANQTEASWWTRNGVLFETFFNKYGTAVMVNGMLGGMIQLVSSFDAKTTVNDATLQIYADRDWNRITGLPSDSSGSHNAALTNNALLCVGGDPTYCSHDRIAGGTWLVSVQKDPKMVKYDISPVTEFLDGEKDKNVRSSLLKATTLVANEKKLLVEWSWNVRGIGGNCNSTRTDGTTSVALGESVTVSSCNNGLAIQLKCFRLTDGSIQAQHYGGSDVFKGKAVATGCSIAYGTSVPDGECCSFA